MPNSFELAAEDTDFIQREMDFTLNLLISKKLLKEGLITQIEYDEIDTILKEKYNPFLLAFISENP
ncbi:MAG: hypothetical protein IKJ59_07150 [Clostridia bacterium]|nr:hypothetical protein [Clostridia bacterium]